MLSQSPGVLGIALRTSVVLTLLTGYRDSRYWIPAVCLFAIGVAAMEGRQIWEWKAVGMSLVAGAGAVLAFIGISYTLHHAPASRALETSEQASVCLHNRRGTPMFTSARSGAAFSSHDPRPSVLFPLNWAKLTGEERASFLREFTPTDFVLEPPSSPLAADGRRGVAEGLLGRPLGPELCPYVFGINRP
jgi:hypothetical protein